jgi:hypothetical protein
MNAISPIEDKVLQSHDWYLSPVWDRYLREQAESVSGIIPPLTTFSPAKSFSL